MSASPIRAAPNFIPRHIKENLSHVPRGMVESKAEPMLGSTITAIMNKAIIIGMSVTVASVFLSFFEFTGVLSYCSL